MARRVGRPRKPYNPVSYTRDELVFMYQLLKKSDNKELKDKVRGDIKERDRITKAYEKAKERIFGKN